MSTPSPAPRRSFNFASWLPSGKAWWWVLGAFAIGLALFAWVWSSNRNRNDGFYRAGEQAPPTSEQPFYAPLPAPAAADGSAPAAPPAAPEATTQTAPDEQPRLVENPNPPAPPQSAPSAQPSPAPAASGAHVPAAPLPGNRAPQYPAASLRRGEGGTVRVRVEVTEQGDTGSVDVAETSGSRMLDRAAVNAVRSWRFRPAMRGGRPAADVVMVPITFNPTQ
jgi:TonB family protein